MWSRNRVKSILYYNQASEVNQSYREGYKRNSKGLKILESYYSYPDYPAENGKPYLQISIYENNPHGLLKLVHTENPDGTFFQEYYLDITKRSTLFTKYVSKYSKERNCILSNTMKNNFTREKYIESLSTEMKMRA